MLEQAMNQSSIQKSEVTPNMDMVVPPTTMQKSQSLFPPQQPVQSVFNDLISLDDEDGFPMPKK
jgi:hypothetical protein